MIFGNIDLWNKVEDYNQAKWAAKSAILTLQDKECWEAAEILCRYFDG